MSAEFRSVTGRAHHFPPSARVVQLQRHDVESVASAGANPAASTSLGVEATADRHRTFNPEW